ncbi:GNAT family N-acetyltransferase [Streptomyces sp. SBT349]|uniref:GNAT family N-acetyltransferase n=1 Tax=Streptomyces sp. SBT349 TaxID=1580539 RepID=UPI00066AAA4F|nr:GNAT family N-acetyltransferase [Streptomyces sp. SBT349]
MSMVFLRRLSRWQAETEREDLGDLYAEAHQDAPGTRPLTRDGFLRHFVDHDVQQPDFDLVVAGDPALVGCAYGFRADRGGRWWDSFVGVPLEIDELTVARQVFVVAGLMVPARRRREGIATRLGDRLLSRSTAALSLAVLSPGNAPARGLYQSWGWSKAGQLTPRDGDTPLEAWAKRR